MLTIRYTPWVAECSLQSCVRQRFLGPERLASRWLRLLAPSVADYVPPLTLPLSSFAYRSYNEHRRMLGMLLIIPSLIQPLNAVNCHRENKLHISHRL